MSERCVVMFTKPARPGRVKTRLIGALTAAQAADLHAAFVVDMLEVLGSGHFALRVAWALDHGEISPPTIDYPSFRQRGEDLGKRLFAGLTEETEAFDFVAAIGSDHPEIGTGDVEAAFALLEAGADVAIGPVEDGGYYLLAVRRDRLDPRLFDGIPWSTATVLETTLDRCRELGLDVRLLAGGADVDRPTDLERLRERLRADPALAPHTARLLAGWESVGEVPR